MDIMQIATITLIKILIIVGILFTVVTFLVYFERKISAWIQDRKGPNRVGPYGLFQSFADVIKLLLKEDIVPEASVKTLHTIAPILTLFIAFSTYAIIPIGPNIYLFGKEISLAVADVNIGILYILGLTSLGVYGITLAGYSSGSKYSLLGGIRSSAQMISYEISMGFSIAAVALLAGSMRPADIVASQSGLMWNAFIQPLGFITFVVAAFAETNRLPFDLPEAEPELVGGYHTEYSSMKFAAFFLAEYTNMIIASAMISLLYLGGWNIPFIEKLGLNYNLQTILQIGAFLFKIGFMIFFFIWVRWSIPRFRYDQLMDIGWKVMFPISLINVVYVAILTMIIK